MGTNIRGMIGWTRLYVIGGDRLRRPESTERLQVQRTQDAESKTEPDLQVGTGLIRTSPLSGRTTAPQLGRVIKGGEVGIRKDASRQAVDAVEESRQ